MQDGLITISDADICVLGVRYQIISISNKFTEAEYDIPSMENICLSSE